MNLNIHWPAFWNGFWKGLGLTALWQPRAMYHRPKKGFQDDVAAVGSNMHKVFGDVERVFARYGYEGFSPKPGSAPSTSAPVQETPPPDAPRLPQTAQK